MASSSTPPASGQNTQNDGPEPFPAIADPPSPKTPKRSNTSDSVSRSRDSSITQRLRSASKKFEESNPPTGFMIATGTIASNLPTLTDIRRGTYDEDGWNGEGQVREKIRRQSLTRTGSWTGSSPISNIRRESWGIHNSPTSPAGAGIETVPETTDEAEPHLDTIPSGAPLNTSDQVSLKPKFIEMESSQGKKIERSSDDTNLTPNATEQEKQALEYRTTPFDNGYEFPPKHTWQYSTVTGLKAFWGFFITPFGFLVTIYGLNVVAWGGMLFLLLCNASPAMCRPTCNDINSPRRKWIEIDSQILNALFCVTGFGLIPWRFRDLYYLMQYRLQKKEIGLRRLAGINRGWFRLAGSEKLPVELGPTTIEADAANVSQTSIPYPLSSIPDAPLTGIRAPPSKVWKLDFVVWAMVWNTFLQAVLSGFMWGFNRYKRPSWSTGLFVALACIVAGCGGIMSFIEGKHVKAIEGVPVSEEDQERLRRDRELGVLHYNNIKGEKPKEKKTKSEKGGLFHRKQNGDSN